MNDNPGKEQQLQKGIKPRTTGPRKGGMPETQPCLVHVRESQPISYRSISQTNRQLLPSYNHPLTSTAVQQFFKLRNPGGVGAKIH